MVPNCFVLSLLSSIKKSKSPLLLSAYTGNSKPHAFSVPFLPGAERDSFPQSWFFFAFFALFSFCLFLCLFSLPTFPSAFSPHLIFTRVNSPLSPTSMLLPVAAAGVARSSRWCVCVLPRRGLATDKDSRGLHCTAPASNAGLG